MSRNYFDAALYAAMESASTIHCVMPAQFTSPAGQSKGSNLPESAFATIPARFFSPADTMTRAALLMSRMLIVAPPGLSPASGGAPNPRVSGGGRGIKEQTKG